MKSIVVIDGKIQNMEKRHQPKAYPLRMPDDMRKEIEESAKDSRRSVNAEILLRLERYSKICLEKQL